MDNEISYVHREDNNQALDNQNKCLQLKLFGENNANVITVRSSLWRESYGRKVESIKILLHMKNRKFWFAFDSFVPNN
jgi:hypothetical protein